jgi:hypothetical protein
VANSEIFDSEIRRRGLGQPVDFEADHIAARAYEHFRRLLETLIVDVRRALPRLPDIFFGFVDDHRLNAFTFKVNGNYFIAITTGTIFLLELVLMRMLADPRLFNEIGQPQNELVDHPPLTGLLPNAYEMFKRGHRARRPEDSLRHFYAIHLFEQALLFLFGHEIAHVTLGHVDYLCSDVGAVFELGWSSSANDEVIERQCIEIQADFRSIYSRIHSFKLTVDDKGQPPWSDAPLSARQALFNFAFSLNVLFRIFGDVRFDSLILESESYPPLPLRRALGTVAAHGFVMETWDHNLRDDALLVLRNGLRYTEHAFATIQDEAPAMVGLSDASSPLGRQHHRRIANHFPELANRLKPFRYEATFCYSDIPLTDTSAAA